MRDTQVVSMELFSKYKIMPKFKVLKNISIDFFVEWDNSNFYMEILWGKNSQDNSREKLKDLYHIIPRHCKSTTIKTLWY